MAETADKPGHSKLPDVMCNSACNTKLPKAEMCKRFIFQQIDFWRISFTEAPIESIYSPLSATQDEMPL